MHTLDNFFMLACHSEFGNPQKKTEDFSVWLEMEGIPIPFKIEKILLEGSVSGWPEGAGSGTRSTYFFIFYVFPLFHPCGFLRTKYSYIIF
jgi:hypothetical protein